MDVAWRADFKSGMSHAIPSRRGFASLLALWAAAGFLRAEGGRPVIDDRGVPRENAAAAPLPAAEVEGFLADKGAHANAAGARFSARLVVSGLRAIPTAPLDVYLNDAGRAIRGE